MNYCYRKGVKENSLEKGTCSTNETRCGCYDVGSTPAVDLWKIPNEVNFCGKRDINLAFEKIYKNMHFSGECYDGFKKCGNVNGKAKGVCIPNSVKCPITDIQFGAANPDTTKYEKVAGNTINLYFSRKDDKNPLVDVVLSENGVCLSNHIQSLTSGRKNYPLRTKDGVADCKRDTRFLKWIRGKQESKIYLTLMEFLIHTCLDFIPRIVIFGLLTRDQ